MKIKGTYTALVTPFLNGEVDYDSFENNIDMQIKAGIDGLLALGTTAETPTLTKEEQTQIIKTIVKKVNKRVPVMVGTGSNSTAQTIEKTQLAKELGADCALIVTPYYNKPTQEGIYLHFKAVVDQVDIPVVVYNIQSRTGKNIETDTLMRISELPNIIAVKEASGNINQMIDVIQTISMKKPDFSVMSGDDAMTFPLLCLGGDGVISVASNLVPGKICDLVNTTLKGDLEQARTLYYELLPLFKAAFLETNPIPIKKAMELCKLHSGEVRLPLCDMLPKNLDQLKATLEKSGILK